MSRGNRPSALRCAAVWLAATVAVATAAVLSGGSAVRLSRAEAWAGTFEGLLADLGGVALLACTGWLWTLTTLTAWEAGRGRPLQPRGLVHRLVLLACGAAVAAGVSAPAVASGGQAPDTAGVLTGLALPDRAAVSAPAHRRSWPALATATREVVVRPGDSLWSIAASGLAADASDDAVISACRALYRANRPVVGPDPDLIRPGQRLRLPSVPPVTGTDQ